MRYRVNWNYQSSAGGPWGAGLLVELDEAVAAAVNASSPGVLTPEESEPEPTEERASEPATGERQVSRAPNRVKRRADAHR